jgi:hypothetical protein
MGAVGGEQRPSDAEFLFQQRVTLFGELPIAGDVAAGNGFSNVFKFFSNWGGAVEVNAEGLGHINLCVQEW